MAVKRGLNMAKGLESLIPQGKRPLHSEKADAPASAEESSKEASEVKKTGKKDSDAEQTGKKGSEAKKAGAKTSGTRKTGAKASDTKGTGAKGSDTRGIGTKKASAAKGAGTKSSEAKESGKKIAAGKDTGKKAAGAAASVSETAQTSLPEAGSEPVELRISQVVPNKNQPRSEFNEEALAELADSIRQFGVLQPLLVQKTGKYYEIIAGERRWRAAKLAGLKKVPVIIKEFTRQEIVEISLIENIQREDLNAIEEALAYRRLLEEFNLTQEEVAERVSRSRSAVTNSMRLLNLDRSVQEMLVSGQISAGHARALLSIENGDVQKSAAEEVAARRLSVRETEQLVKRLLKPRPVKEKKPADTQLEAAYHAIEEQLTERTGTKVTIQRGRGKRGKIEIEYYSQDDLDRIIDLIR